MGDGGAAGVISYDWLMVEEKDQAWFTIMSIHYVGAKPKVDFWYTTALLRKALSLNT